MSKENIDKTEKITPQQSTNHEKLFGLNDLKELGIHERLFKLYDQMLGEVDIIKALKQTTTVVKHLFNPERTTIYRVLKETQELESAAIIGNVTRTIRVPIRENSLAGFCALRGKSFVIADAYGDLGYIDSKIKFDKSWDKINSFRTRDVMCAPAVFKGEVLGVIQVINRKNAPFQENDLAALESVSQFVAYALYHARMYDELATLKCLGKEKAEFMRIIVHELRSPVAASKSLISALLYKNSENSKLNSVLNRVGKRMDQLLDLVEDILHLSRVKAGNPLGKIEICDLNQETEKIYEKYLDQAQEKKLEMSLKLPKTSTMVRIDKKGFNLILSNLISNAVKYTIIGLVEVNLYQKQKWAVIDVKDSGIGIPEQEISSMFNEFFRASNARNSEIKGTGVGLAGVKELVERFRGELELSSEENKGSVFTVRLPIFDSENTHH